MEKDNSFIQSTETRNIPINWELLEKNRNEKATTKKRNLPLATLVRIRGPPKVVDGFSNFNVNKSEQYPHVCTQIDIGTLGPSDFMANKKSSKPRPIILQSRQVLGRYFPKPAFPEDDKGLLFWKNQVGLDQPASISSSYCAIKSTNIIRPKKSCHGPKTATSLRSTSTARGSKSLDSTEIKVRSLSDLKSKHNRQVTFPVKRNNLVGSLSGTPKEIHSRHSAIIGGDVGVKNDIFSNKLVTVSAC